METGELRQWIETGAAVVQALAVPIAAILALRGFAEWRKQRRAERNAELAEELEIALANVVKAVDRIRSPIGFSSDGSTRARIGDKTPEDTQRLNQAFTHVERFNVEREFISKLDELEIRANVRFRRQFAADLQSLRKHLNSLYAAAAIAYRWAVRRYIPNSEKALERVENNSRLLWSESEDDKLDPFDAVLRETVNRISTKLERHKF